MLSLNLPTINLTTREQNGKTEVFDEVRKQFVALTPEEWVRQHFVGYLTKNLGVPAGLIGIEKTIKVGRVTKRCDIIVFDRKGTPRMVVECKKPSVKIKNTTFEQATRYNLTLQISYLVLTNGLQHFCFLLDYQKETAEQMQYIPLFDEMVQADY